MAKAAEPTIFVGYCEECDILIQAQGGSPHDNAVKRIFEYHALLFYDCHREGLYFDTLPGEGIDQ